MTFSWPKRSQIHKFAKMEPRDVPGSKRHPKSVQKASNKFPKASSNHTFLIRSHRLSYDSDFRVVVPLHCFPQRVERNQHMVENHGPRSLAGSLAHSFIRSFARFSVNSRGVDSSDFGHSVPETIASSRRIFLDKRKRYSCVSRVVLSAFLKYTKGAHVLRSSQRLWRRLCLKHKNVLH